MARRPTLSERQRRFVQAYADHRDAARAAIEAGYTPKTAKRWAARLLGIPSVAAALAGRVYGPDKASRQPNTAPVTADRILAEYRRIAFSDLREFVQWGPRGVAFRSSAELDEDQARCVAEVSETVSGSKRFKLHDKKGALDSLARCLGIHVHRPSSPGRGHRPRPSPPSPSSARALQLPARPRQIRTSVFGTSHRRAPRAVAVADRLRPRSRRPLA